MVNKYCIVVTASQYYILGINSILNALEYYKHKDIDFVFIYANGMEAYYELIKDKFSFPITGVRVEDWHDEKMLDRAGNVFIDMSHTWAEFHYMISIRDKYEAICMMDADMLLLGNVEPYLKIAASTDLILVPHNVRSCRWMVDKECFSREIDFIRAHVVEHWILFFSPKHNTDVVEYIWDNRFNNELRDLKDREPQEELFLFSKALVDLKKIDKVLELPGSLWSSGEHFHVSTLQIKRDGEFGIVSSVGDRIFGLHSRWWNKNIIKADITRAKDSPETVRRLKNNAIKGETAINLFNYQGKVTMDDIRKADPRYGSTLDSYEKISY